jgi:glycosyltransferase involved in cell wall biosynthesis
LRRRQKLARLKERVGRFFRVGKKSRTLDFELYPSLKAQPIDLICYLTPLVRPVADIPYIANVWDVQHHRWPFFPEVSHYGEWESREQRCIEALKRAAYVLTRNPAGKRQLLQYYNIAGEQIRMLHEPTPRFALKAGAEPHVPKPLTALGVTGDYLLYPAQFWPHKNHVLLLLVLRLLKEKYHYAPQLVLTGSDKGNKSFVAQRAAEMGLKEQVIFAGFVSRDDLVLLYRQAMATVYPSFCGPENIPPLEAMALGCPAVVGAIEGASDQFGDAALLLDPTQPEPWAEAVQRLRSEPAWREAWIAKGRARAESFTADHFARGLFGIFDEFAAYRRCWPTNKIY